MGFNKMEKVILNSISSLEFGEIRQFRNISIYPLFLYGKARCTSEAEAKPLIEAESKDSPISEYTNYTNSSKAINYGPRYITLDEAIKLGVLRIKEVSIEGSVSKLIAENRGQALVLLLDGEELVGAKQNRILNTTILLDKMSNTKIPVSCVEAHRWDYVSEVFDSSRNLINYDIRRGKQTTVTSSLRNSRRYMSDQLFIWEKIEEISAELNVDSRTKAINDIYRSFDEELNAYINGFPFERDQTGIFVFIDGKIAGFDNVSLPDAYRNLHQKLLKSYCMDALRQDIIRKKRKESKQESKQNNKKNSCSSMLESARRFIEEIQRCNETHFKSPGLGEDYRYESQDAIGSALLYDDTAIHIAFFKNDEPGADRNRPGSIQSYTDRKRRRKSRYIVF